MLTVDWVVQHFLRGEKSVRPWTVPNFLTYFRFAVGFWLVATVVIQPNELASLKWWAFWLTMVAFATDFWDGWIARRWPSQRSKLGEYIDPPADKLVVGAYMLYLYMLGSASGWFEFTCFALVMLREVGMWAYRLIGGADLFPVNSLGKLKTGFQMSALCAYGLLPVLPDVKNLAAPLLLVATALTLWSLVVYLIRGPTRPSVA